MPSPAEKMAKTQTRQRAPRNTVGPRKTAFVCDCREIRESLQLTMDQAAEGCGLSKTAYWQIEHGTDPMLTTALRIAKFYGRTVEELFVPKAK